MSKKIIDVSEHQKKIDWATAKKHIDGAIVRVGYGDDDADQDDDYVRHNLDECERLGIPHEVYLYSYASSDAHIKSEIAHIQRIVKGRPACRVWLDLECRQYQSYWRKAAEAFLGAFPDGGIYSWEWTFTDVLDGIDCPRWICVYGPNDGKPHSDYRPHLSCHGWQYTSKASVPGIAGNVDMSEWYGDFAEVPMKTSAEAPAEAATRPAVRREDIVAQMLAWEGWSEKNGKFKAIIDIYNRYLPTAVKSGTLNYAVKYTDEWCATAASAAYIQAGAPELFPIECGCPRNIELAKKMGIWVEEDSYVPSPADAVLYDWQDTDLGDNVGTPDHVGIVIAVDESKGTFVVMEGNKDEAVSRRTMKIDGRYIRGFICPKFAENAQKNTESLQKTRKAESAQKARESAQKGTSMAKYEKSGTGTPSKKVYLSGILKNNQKVTARLQPNVNAAPCSFSTVKPFTRIDVCDAITGTDGKKWAYCCVGGKYGFILHSSIRDYLRVGGLPVETVAKQVINDDFGKDPERAKALKALGYDAQKVQDKVNEMLGVSAASDMIEDIVKRMEAFAASKTSHEDFIKAYNVFIGEYNKKHGTKHSEVTASTAWCSEFVNLIFWQAGCLDLIGYAKEAPTYVKTAKKLGTWKETTTDIIRGDVVIFHDGTDKKVPNHTEYAIDDVKYDISGNYNNAVGKRSRLGRRVLGRIRPKYPAAGSGTAEAAAGSAAPAAPAHPKVRFWGIRFWESNPEKYGDASAFIQYGADGKAIDHVLLVDTGMNNTDTVKKLQAAGVKKIDAILISHDHSDHYGFLEAILGKFTVGHVYFPDQTGVKKYQPEYANRISKQAAKCTAKKVPFTYLKPGEGFSAGVVAVKAIFQADASKLPEKENHHFINNMSLACQITVDGTWVFHMAGDMQSDSIKQMLAAIPAAQLKCDVFKIQWHGDRGAITKDLAKALKPFAALSNYHNKASHGARKSTYKVLEDNAGTLVMKNYEDGEVYMDMQGGTMVVSGSRSGVERSFTKTIPAASTKWSSYKVALTTKQKPADVSSGMLLAIEPEDYTAAEVAALKAKGATVLGYLSVGSVSDERSYYKSLEKHTLRKLDDWEHEKYLDVCAADVQKWIASRAKEIKAQGFDGWWLDNVDVYEEYKSTETYKAMGAILSSVKALGGYVMVNGGMEYLQKAMNADSGHKGLGSVDGVTQEEVFSMITDYGDGEKDKGKFGTQTSKQSSEYQSHLKRVIRHKMQAFLLEYTTDNTLKLRISAYCKTTGAMACISSDVNL